MEQTTLEIEEIELAPSYNLPIVIILSAIALTLWQTTVGLVLLAFGIFLLIQTFLIKLKFTATALEVYRLKTKIRTFPYSDWQNWVIFFPSIPVLLYFKEVKSIHFVPILFNPIQLKYCLQKYCPLAQ